MSKKNKKLMIAVIAVLVSICITMVIYFNVDVEKIDNSVVNNEIVPQEEISDAQLRETTIHVYFVDENNEIKEEVRKVDSKDLLINPYNIAMEFLISGTNSEGLKTCIPKNVKLNNIEKHGECIVVDLSKEFIEEIEDNVEVQSLAISQIVNTLTQFTEINAVKILIDGQADMEFKNGNIKFVQLFTNED